jgi:hypothetical protein
VGSSIQSSYETKVRWTHDLDVAKACGDEVLEELAPNPTRADHEDARRL